MVLTIWDADSFKATTFEMLSHYAAVRLSYTLCFCKPGSSHRMVFKWMNAFNLAIATVVDLVLTGAFVTIMRQKRTGFSRYVYSSTPVPQRYRSRTETQTTE